MQQEQGEAVANLALDAQPGDDAVEAESFVQACEAVTRIASELTPKTAQAGALKRLADNPAISQWVEEGVKLHHDHSSKTCEFCDQPIPPARLEALAQHFGTADQSLKAEIEAAVTSARSLAERLREVRLPPKQALYTELWKDYEAASEAFETQRSSVLAQLAELDAALAEKLLKRSSAFENPASVDAIALGKAVGQIDALIQRHNTKTGQFSTAKTTAREALERHYLTGIAKQVEDYEKQIAGLKAESANLQDGAADLEEPRGMVALLVSITEKREKVSSAHAGGAEMTERLRNFLGRTDLEFQSNDEGYRVLRRGKVAKRLSEGEKTAIAFLYFVVQLGDHEFDVAEGIVVIDDPISSLDSAAIYQAFASLKNAVNGAKQVFLLTHNFEFLKILLDWLQKAKKQSQYFMIVCSETETDRVATITALDQMLIDHPSEYHFLFKTLYKFKSDGKIATCYHMPNVARKLLETFLEFHAPSTESMYKQLESVTFNESKKTAIYKFTNDHSHRTGKGFDPAIVAESQKNVSYLLEMIKDIAPTHYAGLEKLSA